MNAEIYAFAQVILIDLVLAGDNAVVVGALAASLPPAQRRVALLVGIGLAVAARIILSVGATWLLQFRTLNLVGGALLFWVAWKMWAELRSEDADETASASAPQLLWRAILSITIADISMSLDNVLGVVGAAGGHVWPLVFGLACSVVLMGLAASWIASLMNKHRWIAYVGLSLVVFVAVRMTWHGVHLLL